MPRLCLPTRRRRAALVALVALHGAFASAGAQPAAPQPASRPYTLTVTSKDGVIAVAVKADGAPLSAIAADLSTRLRAPIRLGPSIRTETMTVDVGASALESALASLAPRVLIDYEIRQQAAPLVREIHLLGLDDPEPPRNADANNVVQGLMISGHTEEPTDPSENRPLKVTGDATLLSVTSKKQPLTVVALALGDALGVPVEQTYEATELIDVDIRDAPPEDLIPRISPNLRLRVRADVHKAERIVLRLVVARPGGQ